MLKQLGEPSTYKKIQFVEFLLILLLFKKVQLSLLQAVEARRVVRG
jgi:hypothetical protein